MFYNHLRGHVEALLFANGDPLSASRIAEILAIDEENVTFLIEKLRQDMAASDRGLTIIEVAGGYQLCTKPEFNTIIEQLIQPQESRLSMAALETLAIIAFKQPVTRQEIEFIRGVKVDRVVSNLLERGLIREAGRKETVGRPILYVTTTEFLQCFGLRSLSDLPPLNVYTNESE